MDDIVLKDVGKSYNGQRACTAINLTIHGGEFFTLLGPSGCGKTTILRLIAGFIFPDSGTIRLADRDITTLDAEKRNIGMVFQNYALFPFMSVRQNVEYGLKLQRRTAKEIRDKALYHLDVVGLAGLEDRDINALSGGEQQRVALARSLAVEPRVLLLDEPLSNLDARLRDRMRDELKHLQRKLGITTIFVTHDQREALTMSDRIAIFNKGRCVQVDSPEGIYHRPATSFVARFVGDTNLLQVVKEGDDWYLSQGIRLFHELPPATRFISIRPQDLTISHQPHPHRDLKIQGKISSRQFNGAWTDYLIDLAGIELKASLVNRAGAEDVFAPGQQVSIGFAEDAIHALPQ